MEYKKLYQDLTGRILKGKGESIPQQRQAAFDNFDLPEPLNVLINKVAYQAYKVTNSDIAAVKASGVTEDQLFELVICGAVGQASRQYQSGLTALSEAIQEGGSHAS
jgi:hypothetical protein